MTLSATARNLRIVYSQWRTLVSLLIVFALAGAFLWGGSKLLNSVNGAAPPPPTPTLPAVIEQPAISPTPRSTASTHAGSGHRASTPTATPAPPTPVPSPTPNGPPKVFMTQALGNPTPTSAFPTGLDRIYCWVRNNAVPPHTTAVTFYWTKDASNGFISQFALAIQPGNLYTIAYGPSYMNVTPGKYRCDVIVNQQVIGAAHFKVG